MKAIIPVAGVGERLKPFTLTTPKCLLPVAGKPILAHILDGLMQVGISDFVFIIGYMGEKIRSYVNSHYPKTSEFVEQKQLLGLGYAVKLGLEITEDSPVLIVLGDTIVEMPDRRIIEAEANQVGLVQLEDPRRFGVAILDGATVVSVEEKPLSPRSNYVLAGIYVFPNPRPLRLALSELIEKNIKTRGEFQLTDALALMISRGEKLYWFSVGKWYDCGTPESLIETNRQLLENSAKVEAETKNSIVLQPSWIAKSAKISNSIIGPYVSIGGDAIVEESIISNSIVGSSSHLKRCLLESSIIGNEVTFVGRRYRLNIGDCSQVFLQWEREKERE